MSACVDAVVAAAAEACCYLQPPLSSVTTEPESCDVRTALGIQTFLICPEPRASQTHLKQSDITSTQYTEQITLKMKKKK